VGGTGLKSLKMEDLVPAPLGAHSTVGRATNRGMDKMRSIAVELEQQSRKAAQARKEAAERIAIERAQGTAGGGGKPLPKAASMSSIGGEDEMASPKRKPGASSAVNAMPAQDKTMQSTAMGLAIREKLNLNLGSPTAGGAQGADAQSPTGMSPVADGEVDEPITTLAKREERPSPAFKSQGPAEQVFSQAAAIKGRFFIQGASWHRNPDPGHYRVNDEVTRKYRVKTPSLCHGSHSSSGRRFSPAKSNDLGPEDLTSLDYVFNRSGSIYAQPSMFSTVTSNSLSETLQSWKGQALMSTSIARPDLGNILGQRNGIEGRINMNELTCNTDLAEQERKLKLPRQPEWDLAKQTGRAGFFGGPAQCQFFEVGKYAANHDTVMPNGKKMIGFDKQMSRSSPAVFMQANTPGSCQEKGTSYHPDRSKYRFSRRHKPRITHIMDMEKDLDRPPMYKAVQAHHDTSDPEIVRQVHERAMTSDADTGRGVVERRRDVCLNMSQTLSRERAGHGNRLSQEDISIRLMQGYVGVETSGQIGATIEQLYDSNRRNDDTTVAFNKTKGRGPTRLKGQYSSLHRPRDHAAPNFSRKPELAGFCMRTPVKCLKVRPQSRSHKAMPGWNAEAVEGLEAMPEWNAEAADGVEAMPEWNAEAVGDLMDM